MSGNAPGHAEQVPKETYLAALHIVLVVAYADERFSDEERRVLREQVKTLSDSVEERASMDSFVDSLPTTVESADWVDATLRDVCEKLVDADSRRDAFAMALEMAQADGKIQMSETQALVEIADALEIDPAFARARLRRVKSTEKESLPDLDKTPWQSSPPKGGG